MKIDTTGLEQSHALFIESNKKMQVINLWCAALQYFLAGWNMSRYMEELKGIAVINLFGMTVSAVFFAKALLDWDSERQSAKRHSREVAELLRMAKEANEELGA